MQYLPLSENQYYNQCSALVESLGFILVELTANQRHDGWQVRLVIAKRADSAEHSGVVGIDDCSKVHRLIQPRLEALLEAPDMYMEVTSPGLERLIKNAAEFPLFVNRGVKVWCSDISDWRYGVISAANENELQLQLGDDGSTVTIPYTIIAKAKLDYSREVEK